MLRLKNHTLNQVFRRSQRKADWLKRLNSNAAAKLNRIGNLVTLSPSSLLPKKDYAITLVYIGDATNRNAAAKDIARIQNVLETTFDNKDQATVKFKRINVKVTLVFPFEQSKAA